MNADNDSCDTECWNDKLIDACQNGDVKAARLAVHSGATDFGAGLQFACENAQRETAKMMLDLGAKIDEFCFRLAIENGADEMYEWMAERAVTLDWDNILVGACSNDDTVLAEIALSRGAKSANEALIEAARFNHYASAKLMIAHGICSASVALGVACRNLGDIAMADLLLDAGAYPNHGLPGAFLRHKPDMVKVLIEAGADQAGDMLEPACIGGDVDLVWLTIRHGANNFDAGLRAACESGRLELITLMVHLGAKDLIGAHQFAVSGPLGPAVPISVIDRQMIDAVKTMPK